MSCGNTDQVVVGLTGGIACGKSEALAFFERIGWKTIATDAIAHRILQENSDVTEALREKFGDRVFSVEGMVDKAMLGQLVFRHPSKRKWLEELLHPLIRIDWRRAVKFSEAKRVIVEVPLLFENALQSQFDHVVTVFSNERIQMNRLLERGLDSVEAQNRLSAQIPAGEKACRADFVLFGEGSLDYLRRQVKQLCITFF